MFVGEYAHSTAVQFSKSAASCAILEAHHLPNQNPVNSVFHIANNLYNKANPRPGAFILFSDVVPPDGTLSRGQQIADYLRKMTPQPYRQLYESQKEINPRTGNTVRVWIMHIDHDVFRKWYQEQLANLVQT
jgi:hypothetical protein